jgi:polyisoprenoid-binding protein YceI
MKTNFLNVIAFISISAGLLACGGKKDTVKTDEKQDAAVATELSTSFDVDVTTSTLGWAGTKVGGRHNGTINIQSGSIAVEKNNITAGNFVIDMTTIKDLDLSEKDGNGKLVGHLTSPDFFDVAKFPTSKFEITGAEKLAQADSLGNNYKIMGNLTIKDVTKNITIPANVTMDSTQFTATSKFNIDRADFNVQYGSGKFFKNLGDKAIGDIIEYDLNLKATPKK